MSVSGITIDHSGKVEPKRGDAHARLEAWRKAFPEGNAWLYSGPGENSVDLGLAGACPHGTDTRGAVGAGPSLAEAIHAALDAWEATP